MTVHAANRLVREDGQFGLIAACAAGGQVNLIFCNMFNELLVILLPSYYIDCFFKYV